MFNKGPQFWGQTGLKHCHRRLDQTLFPSCFITLKNSTTRQELLNIMSGVGSVRCLALSPSQQWLPELSSNLWLQTHGTSATILPALAK